VELEFENPSGHEHDCTLFVGTEFAPSGYGWIFPTSEQRVRVGVGVIRPDASASPADLLEQFLRSSCAGRFGLQIGSLVESHFGVIPSVTASAEFCHGRIICAGDSVGQALPLIGEGIRFSIEAGRSAGAAVAEALQGSRDHVEAFGDYESKWKARHQRAFDLAERINKRIARFQDADWDQCIPMLEGFSGDEVARILRMELGVGLSARIVAGGGVRGIRFAGRYLFSRLRRKAA
jgi:digeranylgeranylglycerophospholipid reductase